MQRRDGSRIALVTELIFADKLLVVYNAHLESRSYGRIQAHQIDEILADSRQYPAGTPLILAGDLNTKYFPSVFLHKLQQAGFTSVMGDRTPITHNIPASLDWIFVKGPVTVREGKVRKDLKGSDHYAIYAVVVGAQ
jgi:endonuclease/exonuclease/phosphatase family metal-dependent hydrolase